VRIAIRAVGFTLAAFFIVLVVALARLGIILTFFFTDQGGRDASFVAHGLLTLLYAAVFATAAGLAISSGSYPRVWLVLAALALPMLPLTAMGAFLDCDMCLPGRRRLGPWVSAGLALIIASAAVRIARSRSKVT
jgi:hypothetical protein